MNRLGPAAGGFEEGVPIYRQIAEQIRSEILSGSLAEGARVASTNEYASFFGINPATAAKAFAELAGEGLLVKQRGIGMFVAAGARRRLADQRRQRFSETVLAPLLAEANWLGISNSELIDMINQHTPEESP